MSHGRPAAAVRLRPPEKALLCGIWAGLVLILLTPFVITPQTIFPFIVGKALYARVIIEVVFGFWVLLAFLSPAYRPPRSWLLILFGLALGVSLVAACSGVSVQRSLWSSYERMQGVVDLAHWFVFALVLASVVRTVQAWSVLLNLNLGLSLMMALLAIAQSYYFPDARLLSWDPPTARVAATLGNPIYLSAYLMVNIVIALGFLARSFLPVAAPASGGKRARRRRRKQPSASDLKRQLLLLKRQRRLLWVQRLLWGSAVSIELWALGLAGSRGGMAGLVTALGCLAAGGLFVGRAQTARLAAVGLMGLCGTALVLLLTMFFRPSILMPDTGISNPRLRHLTSSGTIRTRLAAWEAGFKGFADRPFLGWGPENYIVVFGRHVSGVGTHSKIHDSAHNRIVEELATKGLLGLVSYLAVWGLTFLVVLRAAKGMDSRERVLTLFVGAALTGQFVQSQFAPEGSVGFLQYVLLLAFVARLEGGAAGRPAVQLGQGVFSAFERLTRPAFLRPRLTRAAVVVGILVLLGTNLLANRSIYSAAGTTLRTSAPANTLGQLRGAFQQAISDFRPLANYPRLLLFETLAQLWDFLRAQSRIETERMLALVNAEAVAALENNPSDWQIAVALTKLYRVIGASDPAYEDEARRYLERALDLAPRRKEVLELAPSSQHGGPAGEGRTAG